MQMTITGRCIAYESRRKGCLEPQVRPGLPCSCILQPCYWPVLFLRNVYLIHILARPRDQFKTSLGINFRQLLLNFLFTSDTCDIEPSKISLRISLCVKRKPGFRVVMKNELSEKLYQFRSKFFEALISARGHLYVLGELSESINEAVHRATFFTHHWEVEKVRERFSAQATFVQAEPFEKVHRVWGRQSNQFEAFQTSSKPLSRHHMPRLSSSPLP